MLAELTDVSGAELTGRPTDGKVGAVLKKELYKRLFSVAHDAVGLFAMYCLKALSYANQYRAGCVLANSVIVSWYANKSGIQCGLNCVYTDK